MTTTSSDISFYVDCLIIEALAQDEMIKRADGGLVMTLVSKLKDYVSSKIDPNNKVSSVLTILAPGAISVLFKALGLGWLGALLGLAMNVFHIDVGSILTSMYSSVKNMLGSGSPLSSSQIDSMAQGAVQDHSQPMTQEEADNIAKNLQSKSFDQMMQNARFVKLSMIQYKLGKISKTAGLLDALNSRKAKTSSILSRVLGWIFKVVLASAGLMVAGDIANKLLGRSNSLDGSFQAGKSEGPPVSSGPTSTQTKFKMKPGYRPEMYNVGENYWSVNIPNNEQSIGNMIVQFAKDVYQGLDDKDNIIRQTAGFQAIQDKIVWYNRTSAGGPIVYVPPMFNSKKQLVDYFIDEVAEKSP